MLRPLSVTVWTETFRNVDAPGGAANPRYPRLGANRRSWSGSGSGSGRGSGADLALALHRAVRDAEERYAMLQL